MNAIRHSSSRQHGRANRYWLGGLAAAALAGVLLLAMHITAARNRSDALDRMPPTSAVAATSAPKVGLHGGMVLGGATFHENADLEGVPAEPDPSERAVAAYGK